jgi:Ran GTPase-activating protein (RanGAP) involved in mRNA processing and transport
LSISSTEIIDAAVPILTEPLKSGRGIYLKELHLEGSQITSVGISTFCDVLGDEACNQLEALNLGGNNMGDDGVRILCNALRTKQHGLRELHLSLNSLTTESSSWLGQLLNDEHCEITHLTLSGNAVGDEGVRKLCDSLNRRGQCKLGVLDISACSLTRDCLPYLCEILEDEKCSLTELSLYGNDIGDEGAEVLFGTLREEQCCLTKLELHYCSFTRKCMTSVCGALSDKHCRLTNLGFGGNDIGDEAAAKLFDALRVDECSLTQLDLSECSLTKKCMESLCGALSDERCPLTNLDLSENNIGEEGAEVLCSALVSGQCKLTVLNLQGCALTKKCITSLREASENESCKLTKLLVNDFHPRPIVWMMDSDEFEDCLDGVLEIYCDDFLGMIQ